MADPGDLDQRTGAARMLDHSDPIADAVGVKAPPPISLTLGLAGLGFGIACLATDSPALGLVAGLLAFGGVAVPLLARAPTGAGPTDKAYAPMTSSVMAAAGSSPSQNAGTITTSPGPEGGLLDPETGLFSEEFFKAAVETRVLAARRHLRPVAVVLFDVIDGVGPGATRQAMAAPVAHAIKQTLREADTACRLRDGRYGFVLEDTPEDGAIWTVERLRRRLSEHAPDQTRWAGIACYPAHAFSADEVMAKAELAFGAAREWAQDRIEVAAHE